MKPKRYTAKHNVMVRYITIGGYGWTEVQKNQVLELKGVLREDPKFLELEDSEHEYFMTPKQLERNFRLVEEV
jgi:hypothetical protein